MPDSKPVHHIPQGHHTVTPYLVVPDGDALVEFMEKAFGARVVDRNYDGEGRLMHADLVVGDSHVMLGQANEQFSATRAMVHLYVEDVDATYRRALDAGAESIREVSDQFYGDRSGGVQDPSGTQWWIATHVEDVSPEEMERRMREMGG